MSARRFLLTAWTWSPGLVCGAIAAVVVYGLMLKRARLRRLERNAALRPLAFVSAVLIVVAALASPLNALAQGCLFSAHMAQHLILLLVAPGLLVLSLPPSLRLGRPSALPAIAWVCGVGAMWLWHVPALCDAAAANSAAHGFQSVSLLAMGTVFWWPIFAPHPGDRVAPWVGVAYLFSACLACTALGVLITLTPLEVCPIFREPVDPYGMLATIRGPWGISAQRDRDIGGLLMWVPMCSAYVGAILVEVMRWYNPASAGTLEAAS